jgi:hypothetical protein
VEVPADGFKSFTKFTFLYARAGKHEEAKLAWESRPGALVADDTEALKLNEEFLMSTVLL